MWRNFVNLLRRGITLWTQIDRLEADLDRLLNDHEKLNEVVERLIFEQQRDREHAILEREKVAQLEQKNARLNDTVTRLECELQRDRDNAAHQRVNLQLLLENTLLKFERRLPPAKPTKDK